LPIHEARLSQDRSRGLAGRRQCAADLDSEERLTALGVLKNITDEALAACIAKAFEECFASYDTVLEGGAREPLYQPSHQGKPAKLVFREDYPASALHEIAHWCIAGARRRQQEDFGYEYIFGPRSPEQQDAFFAAELKTQSLERAFATALGLEFRPSADNLNADVEAFSAALTDDETALNAWLISTSGQRARHFLQHLSLLKTSLAEETSADNSHDSQSGAVQ
jgi:elongation factor P hydroxylase